MGAPDLFMKSSQPFINESGKLNKMFLFSEPKSSHLIIAHISLNIDFSV